MRVLFLFIFFFLSYSNVYAASPIPNANLQETAYGGYSWLTFLSNFDGTGTYSPAALWYSVSSPEPVYYSTVADFTNYPTISYTYTAPKRVVLNSAEHYPDIPPDDYIVVICPEVVSSDFCGFDISTDYPTRLEALGLTDASYIALEKTTTSHSQTVLTDLVVSSLTYQTRFTDLALNVDSYPFLTDISWFVEQSEININEPTRNPTMLRYCWSSRASTTEGCRSLDIDLPLAQGDTTFRFDLDAFSDFSTLPDGDYDLFFRFDNKNAILEQSLIPFSETYIYSFVSMSGGSPDYSNTRNEFYNNLTPPEISQTRDCSLTQIEGCFINVITFLFIPSTASFDKITSLFSDSTFPFVASVYAAYDDFQDAVDSPSPSNTLAYNLVIPGTSIDVEMFSVETMTQLMGDSQSTFRSIALVALIIGFISMLVLSINRMLFFTEAVTGNKF